MLNMLPKFELVPISRYFITLAEARRPSMMPLMQNSQAGLQQDDVGGLARDVHRRRDGDAHIGGVQRRRVVDAVAHVADHVAAVLQREDDAVLLHRRDARENGGLLRPMCPARRRWCARVRRPARWSVLQAHLLANVPRRPVRCRRSEFSPARRRASWPRATPRHRDRADRQRRESRRESASVRRRPCKPCCDLDVAIGHGQHAKSLAAQIVEGLAAALLQVRARRARRWPSDFAGFAERQDSFGRALGDQQCGRAALRRALLFDDDGNAAALEIERESRRIFR